MDLGEGTGSVVGYMPQELALHDELSAKETIEYYAKLYRMDKGRKYFLKLAISLYSQNENILLAAARSATAFLLDLLGLNSKSLLSTRVSSLSGGQQRRVSFASALLHSPPVLVMDEPTVGADPALRRAMWAHLARLAHAGGVAVLLTTHYLQEAEGRADQAGFAQITMFLITN